MTVEKDVPARCGRLGRGSGAEDDQILMAERPQGDFSRQLFLGESLDRDQIAASYDNGVLTLTIPVAEEAEAPQGRDRPLSRRGPSRHRSVHHRVAAPARRNGSLLGEPFRRELPVTLRSTLDSITTRAATPFPRVDAQARCELPERVPSQQRFLTAEEGLAGPVLRRSQGLGCCCECRHDERVGPCSRAGSGDAFSEPWWCLGEALDGQELTDVSEHDPLARTSRCTRGG